MSTKLRYREPFNFDLNKSQISFFVNYSNCANKFKPVVKTHSHCFRPGNYMGVGDY